MKKCNICDSTLKVCFNKNLQILLCAKHRYQLLKWGKIKRTIYTKNEIINKKDYAEIILYNKNGEETNRTKIDKNDISLVKNYKWRLTEGYCATSIKRKTIRLHTFFISTDKDLEIDHKNRDKLDNRRKNLRLVTRQQNSCNIEISKANTSRKRGVGFNKRTNKWRARITYKQKEYHLGEFSNYNDAVKVRVQAENKYFGCYAPYKN